MHVFGVWRLPLVLRLLGPPSAAGAWWLSVLIDGDAQDLRLTPRAHWLLCIRDRTAPPPSPTGPPPPAIYLFRRILARAVLRLPATTRTPTPSPTPTPDVSEEEVEEISEEEQSVLGLGLPSVGDTTMRGVIPILALLGIFMMGAGALILKGREGNR